MKVGDIVKYKHGKMHGVVLEVRKTYWAGKPERARVFWNITECNEDEVMDWVEDLELVNE